MSSYVVIGTSPYNDVSVAVGPYRSSSRAFEASRDLDHKGWVTEVCELCNTADVDSVTNDEGISA